MWSGESGGGGRGGRSRKRERERVRGKQEQEDRRRRECTPLQKHTCTHAHTHDSLRPMFVTRDVSQVAMLPSEELASQFAPVPNAQTSESTAPCPYPPSPQYISPASKISEEHAPIHPSSAACSALRFAGAKIAKASAVLVPHLLLGP